MAVRKPTADEWAEAAKALARARMAVKRSLDLRERRTPQQVYEEGDAMRRVDRACKRLDELAAAEGLLP